MSDKELRKKLSTIKASLTKISNFVDKEPNPTLLSLTAKLDNLQTLLPKFEDIYFKWLDLVSEDLDATITDGKSSLEKGVEDNEYLDFEEKYFLTQSQLTQKIRDAIGPPDVEKYATVDTGSTKPSQGKHGQHGSDTGIRIPRVEISKFNGRKDDWIRFFEVFKSIIHENENIRDIHKFHYLLSCLEGEAAQLVNDIDVSEENYSFVWEKLVNYYKNNKILTETHIGGLFTVKKVETQSATALRELHNVFTKNINALKKLGVKNLEENVLLVYLLASKFDNVTLKTWEEETASCKEMPSFSVLETFLVNQYNFLEAYEKKSGQSEKLGKGKNHSAAALVSSVSPPKHCKICNVKYHPVYKCRVFLNKSLDDRRDLVKKIGSCWQCLDYNHQVAECKGRVCSKCNQKHNYLLCKAPKGVQNQENTGVSLYVQGGTSESQGEGVQRPKEIFVPGCTDGSLSLGARSAASSKGKAFCGATADALPDPLLASRSMPSQIIFPTCSVLIYDFKNEPVSARFLLDSGSGLNFINQNLSRRLSIKIKSDNLHIHGIGNTTTRSVGYVTTMLESRFTNYNKLVNFYVIPEITKGNVLNCSVDIGSIILPEQIEKQLADPHFCDSSKPIDGILGAGIFFDVLHNPSLIKYKDDSKCSNSPPVINTTLGWVISGEIKSSKSVGTQQCLMNSTIVEDDTFSLDSSKNDFSIPSVKRKWEEEAHCERIFMETLKMDGSGRYIVSLPFRSNPQVLGNSLEGAMKRFYQLEAKFAKNPDLKEQYSLFINQYLEMGHMELIPDSEIHQSPHYYLPHHAVYKDSQTTSLRVVFDASFETDNKTSLNGILYPGPPLQMDVFDILIGFRFPKFGISADIAKMYRQFWVNPDQHDFQRIIWRQSAEEPIQHYRLKTITYGTSPAPFLAIRCLQQRADEVEPYDFEIANKIRTKFFVDDYLDGADTFESLRSLQLRLEEALKVRHLPLRKWCSNSKELMGILSTNGEDHYIINLDKSESVKALGVVWNPEHDNFILNAHSWQAKKISKRTILADIHAFWDPLGFLVPILIKGKMFLQELWRIQSTWDQSLPEYLCVKWLKYRQRLTSIENILVPRRVLVKNPENISFHGFCDASEKAYGACIYVRSIDSEGHTQSHLLCAKARVAPKHTITLPRMELLGAVLLVELMKDCIRAQNLKNLETHYWSDSKIVLAWINGCPQQWKTYVANRVSVIQESTKPEQWHHVVSKENPADIASRGIAANELNNKSLWWNGPTWLVSDVKEWFPWNSSDFKADIPEQKKISFSLTAVTDGLNLIHKYSSWKKLVRVTAYILRFIENCRIAKRFRKAKELMPSELRAATLYIIGIVQSEAFPEEVARLKSNKQLQRTSKLLPLSAYMDECGVFRVGGRVSNANIPEARKHPLILPYKHHITELILEDLHRRNFHVGPNALLTIVRGEYWPVNGKSAAKAIVHKCVTCKRANATTLQPMMAALPKERVEPGRCFESCGIDFCGPIWIKIGTRKSVKQKAYIALFVCFAVKAIHLELVTDMSSQAFLAALRRFFSRRGTSRRIYSDNGSNFVGAQKDLRYFADNKDIRTDCVHLGVEWHFIPPGSPHFGGLWESSVKSLKSHMKKTMDGLIMTFEEAYTVLTGIEACLNSRPLTALSDDPNDPTPLTPSHFLVGSPLNFPPEPDYTHNKPLVKRWQRVQQLQQEFWVRWSEEYLSSLQTRHKWRFLKDNIPIGTLVTIRDENLKPMEWRMAKIISLHPGKDGVARVATLRLSGGQEIQRPLVKLCPILEATPEDTEE